MARKSPQTTVGQAVLTSLQAYEKLLQQLQLGEQVSPVDEDSFNRWVATAHQWVRKAFGENSREDHDFFGAQGINSIVVAGETDLGDARRDSLRERLNLLRAFTDHLKGMVDLDHQSGGREPAPTRSADSRRVFLVHGRDEGVKQTVARFLEKLDLVPIILHEQPNSGRTIIEKFEAYTDVAFAVVLLTPDDRGGLVDAPFEQQSPRARQNVILELGYFLGKLGRQRVCALYKEGTEIPSDYQGVAFVPLDPAGAWRFLLGRELQQVVPGVDLNKAG